MEANTGNSEDDTSTNASRQLSHLAMISTRNDHSHKVFPGRSEAQVFVQKMNNDTKIQQVPVNSSIIAICLQLWRTKKQYNQLYPSDL